MIGDIEISTRISCWAKCNEFYLVFSSIYTPANIDFLLRESRPHAGAVSYNGQVFPIFIRRKLFASLLTISLVVNGNIVRTVAKEAVKKSGRTSFNDMRSKHFSRVGKSYRSARYGKCECASATFAVAIIAFTGSLEENMRDIVHCSCWIERPVVHEALQIDISWNMNIIISFYQKIYRNIESCNIYLIFRIYSFVKYNNFQFI